MAKKQLMEDIRDTVLDGVERLWREEPNSTWREEGLSGKRGFRGGSGGKEWLRGG